MFVNYKYQKNCLVVVICFKYCLQNIVYHIVIPSTIFRTGLKELFDPSDCASTVQTLE